MKNIFKYLLKHKIIIALLIIILGGGGYYFYSSKNKTVEAARYVLGKVEKGTVIATVSGSGQVSASNQVEIKTKASGDITIFNIKAGQEVKAGTLLAQINAKDEYQSIRDAEANLESAKLSLEKLKKPTDASSLIQAENSLTSARTNLDKLKLTQETDLQKAKETKLKAGDNLKKSYEDAYNKISETFLDLPDIITGLHNAFFSYEIGKSEATLNQWQTNDTVLANTILGTDWDDANKMVEFIASTKTAYNGAKTAYDANLTAYKNSNRYSSTGEIERLLEQTLETTKKISDTAKDEINAFDFWVEYRNAHSFIVYNKVSQYQTSLTAYSGQLNSHLSALLSAQSAINDYQDAITSAERDIKTMEQNNPVDIAAAEASIKDKEAALANLKAGTDALDIKAQELTIKQRQNALADARSKLADYTIRAPFDGVAASVAVAKGDTVANGTALATLITKKQIAGISLNEVDAAKIKSGQKATLTFDALSGLSLTGEVAEIDTLGTVSQGVVSYSVKIIFDTQDDRVKPGMSVSATITTDQKLDVLIAPNTAIKTGSDNTSYVEILNNGQQSTDANGIASNIPPEKKFIEIGLFDNSNTEIKSGLKEGDLIVIRTITNTVTTNTNTQQQSGLRLFGGGGMR